LKIIIINTVVKEGSTGKIAYGLYNHLIGSGHDCKVCYGRGEIYPDEPDLIRIDSKHEVYIHAGLARVTGLQGYYSRKATGKLLSILDKFNPNVVYLFNLHGYYLNEFNTLNYLKQNNKKTVYVMLDEYPFLGKCCYNFDCMRYQEGCGKCPDINGYPKSVIYDRSQKIWNRKNEIYNGYNNIRFASVPYTVTKAKQSTLLRNKKFFELDTGVDLDVFSPRNSSDLHIKHQIPEDELIALCVANYSDKRKGSQFFLDTAFLSKHKNVCFIHVGFNVKTKDYPSNFIPVSYIKDQDELAEYYSLADILVCPSLADAMPNVCLEALGCGTPVCGFDCGGTPYTASQEYGTFVPVGDIQALAEVILKTPKKTQERIKKCRDYALSRFSHEMYFKKLESFVMSEGDINDSV